MGPSTAATESRTEASAVVAAAREGDESAFAELVEAYRPELQAHCYRMLGSFEDAEDLVQETFLRAWRRRKTFEGRSTFRAWLYRIATNACLDALDRRPRVVQAQQGTPPLAEVPWLQPYPDQLLETVPAGEAEPEAEVVAKETIELAFIAAIQLLPPKQRAVLIARDVLGWTAAESASLLGLSVAATNSALQRARGTMKQHLPRTRLDWSSGDDASDEERGLLQRYMGAIDRGDPDAMAELLRDDAFCSMPPQPDWYVGAQAIVAAWVEGGFGSASFGRFRCVPARANGQPAVAVYRQRPGDTEYRPLALDVLRIEDGLVAEVIVFGAEVFGAFGLPATL
jgi:RNA polymerase sigma-70 factor, ECF subfamily